MAMMCEECKCSTYLDEETGMYSCENECPCCNDPEWESDWDTHVRIMKQVTEYLKLYKLSLDQDSEKIWNAMDQIDDLESDEYEELNIQDIRNGGEIAATNHILKYIEEVTNV